MADPNAMPGSMPGTQQYTYAPTGIPPGMAYPQMAQYAQPPPTTFHHQQQQQQQQALKSFWAQQMEEVKNVSTDPAEFKNHQLPLARIKKIMKSDEDVRMISAEAPVLFAKACDMFILELTLRSWIHSEENKRRTLQRNDIAAAITKTDIFDFLVDIVPRDERTEGEGAAPPAAPGVQQPAQPQAQAQQMHAMQPVGSMPYYLAPGQGMIPASSAGIIDPNMMYGGAQFMARMPQGMQWPQGMPQQAVQPPPSQPQE
mmetsp:Transcript_11185/g.31722  ORF Transcript_11185/g.31722 Transcript_11185/m.31722 type:complete len:257 (-) Transcript_11185:1060-1830(-)